MAETLQDKARRRVQDVLDKHFRGSYEGAPLVSIPAHEDNLDVLLCSLADALDAAIARAALAEDRLGLQEAISEGIARDRRAAEARIAELEAERDKFRLFLMEARARADDRRHARAVLRTKEGEE